MNLSFLLNILTLNMPLINKKKHHESTSIKVVTSHEEPTEKTQPSKKGQKKQKVNWVNTINLII